MPTTPKAATSLNQELTVLEHELELGLESLSPVSFMRARVGDLLRIKKKAANQREYRDKIGAAGDCLLAFKGETKIGMIPRSAVIPSAKSCRVIVADPAAKVMRVRIRTAPAASDSNS